MREGRSERDDRDDQSERAGTTFALVLQRSLQRLHHRPHTHRHTIL